MIGLKSILSVALFVAAAFGLEFTSTPTSVQAGGSYTITWSGENAGQPVTIILRKGNSQDLTTVTTITSTASGGSYTWTPDTSISDGGDYALMIQQGSTTNYSGQFSISGGTAAQASSSQASIISSQVASASSAASSASSSASAAASSASASLSSVTASLASATPSSNSTTLSTTGKPSATSASRSSTPSATGAPSTGGAFALSGVQSPIALILGAIVAMVAL